MDVAMKLSEILQRLEELKQENGDIELQHINDVIKTIPADWFVTFPPKKPGNYLVTMRVIGDSRNHPFVWITDFDGQEFKNPCIPTATVEVLAWAEPPEPYKEKT